MLSKKKTKQVIVELEMVRVDNSFEEFSHEADQIGRQLAGEVGHGEMLFLFVLFSKLEEIVAHLYSDESDPIHGENLMSSGRERENCWSNIPGVGDQG